MAEMTPTVLAPVIAFEASGDGRPRSPAQPPSSSSKAMAMARCVMLPIISAQQGPCFVERCSRLEGYRPLALKGAPTPIDLQPEERPVANPQYVYHMHKLSKTYPGG